MKANPDKSQIPAIGNKTNAKNITFNLKEDSIKCEGDAK